MGEPLIEVRDLAIQFHTYEGSHQVIDGVDLTIDEGETVALVGETGCGKSVTGKAIMGTLPQPPGEIVRGEIRYRGTDLLADAEAHQRATRDRMSMVFQDPMTYLSPVFTVGTMLEDVVRYRGRGDPSWSDLVLDAIGGRDGDRQAIRERCAELLGRLQIPDPEGVLDRYPVELSGGMRQRVLVAMALINDPEFLIADEPTTALDVTVQDQLLDLLSARIDERDLTVLYITHNLGVARKLADRIYVMYAGTIAESAPTRELFDAPLHPYTRGLLESIPTLVGFESGGIGGRIPDYTDPPRGCRFHPRCPAFMAGTCDADPPERFRIDRGHDVACYLYEDRPDTETARSIAESEVEFETEPGRAADSAPASRPAEHRATGEPPIDRGDAGGDRP